MASEEQPEPSKKRSKPAAMPDGGSGPASPARLPPIAKDADDLREIKKALEDAAAVSGGVWLPYLFTLLYLADATATVTQTDLLLQNPVKFPYLNIELPLPAFFVLAPALVIVVHAYALVYFGILGQKACRFDEELKRQLPDRRDAGDQVHASPKEIRDKLRRLLPSNIFVQMLAGPLEVRHGIFGFVLKLIALTTLVVLPVLLLLLLQVQFLPHHDLTITWAQRALLFLDVGLLWVLRPPTLPGGIGGWSLEEGEGDQSPKRVLALRAVGLGIAGTLSLVAIWLSIVVATIPGEWQERALAWLDPPLWPTTYYGAGDGEREGTRWISAHESLFGVRLDALTFRRRSLFSNTLVLPAFDLYEALKIDEPKKLDWKGHLIDLRGRHLENAALWHAVLPKADLTGAHLEGASLVGAQLIGTLLDGAELIGASLEEASLEGASLTAAHLQGASFQNAYLQGASLNWAQLQGATLKQANLQGASIVGAQLQGALLFLAELQGADLSRAELQGANLSGAELQGASLLGAELQGVSLRGADITAANLQLTYLWRAMEFGFVRGGSLRANVAEWGPMYWLANPVIPIPWSDETFADLQNSLKEIPEGKMRDDASKRIEVLKCDNPDKMLASCDPKAPLPQQVQQWKKTLEEASVDNATYGKALAASLKELVCTGDANAIYILRGVIKNDRIKATGDQAPGLIDALMSKDCPVSQSLADSDRASLLSLKKASAAAN